MSGGMDSTKIENAFKLEEYHRDFLNNRYFQVFTIMTPRKDWLCIDLNTGDINESVKQAKEAEISNIVVMDGDITKGYINVNEWNEKKIAMDDWKQISKSYKDHLLSHSLTLLETVKKMANDSIGLKRESSPLYFVFDYSSRQGEPIGIVTYWDLNRAPAYIFSYAIQAYLEQIILLAIRDSHPQKLWKDHSMVIQALEPNLREIESRRIICFLGNGKYNYEALSKWGFSEMLQFYKSDPHINKELIEFSDDAIDSISIPADYRNRVGHPIKLLVEDDDCFHKDLERLSVIWKMGKEAFLRFTNPKVRHTSPSAEERKKIFKGQNVN